MPQPLSWLLYVCRSLRSASQPASQPRKAREPPLLRLRTTRASSHARQRTKTRHQEQKKKNNGVRIFACQGCLRTKKVKGSPRARAVCVAVLKLDSSTQLGRGGRGGGGGGGSLFSMGRWCVLKVFLPMHVPDTHIRTLTHTHTHTYTYTHTHTHACMHASFSPHIHM